MNNDFDIWEAVFDCFACSVSTDRQGDCFIEAEVLFPVAVSIWFYSHFYFSWRKGVSSNELDCYGEIVGGGIFHQLFCWVSSIFLYFVLTSPYVKTRHFFFIDVDGYVFPSPFPQPLFWWKIFFRWNRFIVEVQNFESSNCLSAESLGTNKRAYRRYSSLPA